jgi:hypothetical protein
MVNADWSRTDPVLASFTIHHNSPFTIRDSVKFGAIDDLQRATGFVVGKSLSLADIAICAQAEWIGDSTIGKRALQARPLLIEYFKRVDALTHADRA